MRIAHSGRPNFALRAWHPKGSSFRAPGLIGGPTLGIRTVLTGPRVTASPSPPMPITRYDFYFPGNQEVDAPIALENLTLFTEEGKGLYRIRHALLTEVYAQLSEEETRKAQAWQDRCNKLMELADAGDKDAKRQIELWQVAGVRIERNPEPIPSRTVRWNDHWYPLGRCEVCGVQVLTTSLRRSQRGHTVPICSQHCADKRWHLRNDQKREPHP